MQAMWQERVDSDFRGRVRRLVESEVRAFKSSLELVALREELVHAAIGGALAEVDRTNSKSMEATAAFGEEALRVRHQLDDARHRALAGAKALDSANAQWDHGAFAACSRLLAASWPTTAEPSEAIIERLAARLKISPSQVREQLAAHQVGRKMGGPQKAADAVIAILVGVNEKTVSRWRQEPGARFFDRLIETAPVEPTEDSESPSGFANYAAFLSAHGITEASAEPGSLGAALAAETALDSEK
jgi:hypothetical protein